MAGTKRIFISDVHLSSKARYIAKPEIRRARFIPGRPENHKTRLVNFLNKSVLAKEHPPIEALTKLALEGELEHVGDRLCQKKGYKIVIFGHTYKAKMDKDSFLFSNV